MPASETVCMLQLGVGHMAIETGYSGGTSMMASVLRSAHTLSPARVGKDAGYYGQAVMSLAYTLVNLITPTLRPRVGTKRMIFLGSLMFTLFLISFFYLTDISLYICCALVGIGNGVFFSGHGGYLVEHSSRRTIEINSSLAIAVMAASSLLSGLVMLLTTSLTEGGHLANNTATDDGKDGGDEAYRIFSDAEIRYMYGAFALLSLGANVIFALLPSAVSLDSLRHAAAPKTRRTLGESLLLMARSMARRRMLLLAVFFCYLGVYNSFAVSIYPTSFAFTKSLSANRFLPAYSWIASGAADMTTGFTIHFLSRRIRHFGLFGTATVGCLVSAANFLLIFASTPNSASMRPTDEAAPWIQPSITICLIISVLIGVADSCVFNARNVICALVLPGRTDQAFAINKFYQSLIPVFFFFASPQMSITAYFGILVGGLIFGGSLYFYVAIGIVKRERRVVTKVSSNETANSS